MSKRSMRLALEVQVKCKEVAENMWEAGKNLVYRLRSRISTFRKNDVFRIGVGYPLSPLWRGLAHSPISQIPRLLQ